MFQRKQLIIWAFFFFGGVGSGWGQEGGEGTTNLRSPVVHSVAQVRRGAAQENEYGLLIEGGARPFDIVVVTFDDEKKAVAEQVDADGVWRVEIRALAGEDVGTMTVRAFDSHDVDKDVVVKEKAIGSSKHLGPVKPLAGEDSVFLFQSRLAHVGGFADFVGTPIVYSRGSVSLFARPEGDGWKLFTFPIPLAVPASLYVPTKISRVFFATNRNRMEVLRGQSSGVAERGPPTPSVTYGRSEAALSFGSVIQSTSDHISYDIEALEDGAEPEDVGESVVLYVHGCCNSFESAYEAALNLKDFGRLKSEVLLFSWPTGSGVSYYAGDKDMVSPSRRALGAFLRHISKWSKVRNIDIVAHSLGNQVLLEALRDLAVADDADGRDAKSKIRHLIFASPDVERSVFSNGVGALHRMGTTKTLYVSGLDLALWASNLVSRYERAGYIWTEKPLVLPDLDTVDVSRSSSRFFSLNHSAFMEELSVLNDLSIILNEGKRPPTARQAIFREVPTDEGMYWEFPDLRR